jgi:deoxyribonuclease-4
MPSNPPSSVLPWNSRTPVSRSSHAGIHFAISLPLQRFSTSLITAAGNPQSCKAPKPRDDAERLKAAALPIYVHAPYLINVASANNRVRIPSRKILQQTCDAAADIGAAPVIVHGGHVADDDELDEGFQRWRKALDQLETNVPVYLENTAGGDHAMARHFDTIARLWDVIGDAGIGFCLDTCHAWAAGEALVDAVDRIKGITGRIDLVHCNDSKHAAGSGRDRHANLGAGEIGTELVVAAVKAADAGHLRNGRRRPQGRHRVPAGKTSS